jgi:glycine/D-amino acid oxidase-like deaminating enzyme
MSLSSSAPRHVVIVGAGVVGTTTAYYLAEKFGITSTLIDPSGTIAPAASGKAGGFLALDWNDWSPAGTLARRSFQLHQQLADTIGHDKIQYRRLTCATISVHPNNAAPPKPGGKKLEFVEWAQDDGASAVLGARPLGDERTIAQVHPKMLCDALWQQASKPKEQGGVGSTLVKGKAVRILHEKDKPVGVQLDDDSVVQGDAVLIACGPWSANIMTGVKYHSVLIPTDRTLTQCVFFSGCGDPEVYVRPDNTAYCCGFPDASVKVTEQPGREEVRPAAVQRIVDAVRAASGGTTTALAAEPSLAQSCYLPTTPDNLPIMGRLPADAGGGDGCFIATGHSCWGILMGPATGESMASLIATGVDPTIIEPFDPTRFHSMRILEHP